MMVEEYLGKDEKLYAAFIDIEKACDRIDKEALWNVLKINGVGEQLYAGVKAFNREANMGVRVDGEQEKVFL